MKNKIEEILKNSYTNFGEFDESKATKELLNLFSVSKPVICQDWIHQDMLRMNYKFCSICGTRLESK